MRRWCPSPWPPPRASSSIATLAFPFPPASSPRSQASLPGPSIAALGPALPSPISCSRSWPSVPPIITPGSTSIRPTTSATWPPSASGRRAARHPRRGADDRLAAGQRSAALDAAFRSNAQRAGRGRIRRRRRLAARLRSGPPRRRRSPDRPAPRRRDRGRRAAASAAGTGQPRRVRLRGPTPRPPHPGRLRRAEDDRRRVTPRRGVAAVVQWLAHGAARLGTGPTGRGPPARDERHRHRAAARRRLDHDRQRLGQVHPHRRHPRPGHLRPAPGRAGPVPVVDVAPAERPAPARSVVRGPVPARLRAFDRRPAAGAAFRSDGLRHLPRPGAAATGA